MITSYSPTTLGSAQWLALSAGPVYSVLHEPDRHAARRTVVLMVPPFGWDEVVSHRARRFWAIQLAQAGLPALRMDLPGTGDSWADAHEPDLVHHWTRAITETGRWLLDQERASRLAVIAFGIGGLLSCRALADGAPIDDLVLWASMGKGSRAVREAQAQAAFIATRFPEDLAGPSPTGGANVAGHLLSDETLSELKATDVAKLTFPDTAGRRALLLGRDGLGVDHGLARAMRQAGVNVTEAVTNDYHVLMRNPQSMDVTRPVDTISLTLRWLTSVNAPSDRRSSASLTAAPRERLSTSGLQLAADSRRSLTVGMSIDDGRQLNETILNLRLRGERASAVLTAPSEDAPRAQITAVLLNSGAIRKVGLHRMWVELARSWAARGVPTVRVDFGAVGDSGGDDTAADTGRLEDERDLTSPQMVEKTTELLEELRIRGQANRFVLVGHCSGAYLGFRAALADPGVRACFGIDQQAFAVSDDLFDEHMFERIMEVARRGVLRRLRERGLSAQERRRLARAVRYRWRRSLAGGESVGARHQREGLALLDSLSRRDLMIRLLLSRDESPATGTDSDFRREFDSGRWPNIEIDEIPTHDHMLRATWVQRVVRSQLDLALDELLARERIVQAVSTAA